MVLMEKILPTDLLRANALRDVAVSSVSCEQIWVFFQTMFDFFLSHCVIPNSFRDLTFIFSKGVLNLFYHFFVFILFIKIITTSSKGKEPARSPKPAVSLPLNPSLIGHGLGLCPKNLHASK